MFGYNYGVGLLAAKNNPVASNTLSLLHMQGTNGGASFPDANTARTWAPTSLTTSTTEHNFGTASADFNGSTSELVSNQNIDLSTTNWTMECFVYLLSTGSMTVVDTGSCEFFLSTTTVIFTEIGGGSQIAACSATILENTWTHIAVVKTGTDTIKFFVGGVLQTNTLNMSSYTNPNAIYTIGNGINGAFNGFIDELRISKIARYSSTFTPPSAPFVLD
jgi:hypothetical protein